MKVAVIGAGITGNVVARGLHRHHDLTVFEAGNHVGGHSHTHAVEVGGRTLDVDTGFIVYNDATYPRFSALLAELGVATQEAAMSFSVRNEMSGLEYASASINTLFAQRLNLLRPRFHRMWAEILRFNRHAAAFHDAHAHHEWTLGDYVREQRYSDRFVGDYLVPMASAIWSAAPADIGAMPARFLIGFFRNHGMLTVNDRPQWRTVCGGSAQYVAKLVAPFRSRIHLRTPVLGGNTPERFKDALHALKQFLDSRHQRILNINAWNEWTEGSYLEPDTVNGLRYLEAVKEVFG